VGPEIFEGCKPWSLGSIIYERCRCRRQPCRLLLSYLFLIMQPIHKSINFTESCETKIVIHRVIGTAASA
jgi:hypothetical protein